MSESLIVQDVRELLDADPGTDLIGYTGTSREAIAYLVEHGELPPPEIERICTQVYPIDSDFRGQSRLVTVDLRKPPQIMLTEAVLNGFLRKHRVNFTVTSDCYDALAAAENLARYYAVYHRLGVAFGQPIGTRHPDKSLCGSSKPEVIDECENEGAGIVLSLRRHVLDLVEPPIARVLRPQSGGDISFQISDEPDLVALAHLSFKGLSLKQDYLLGTSDISSIVPLANGDREFLRKLGV